jgi:hypothetical protein
MRLLHTSTLKVVNFPFDNIPPYAILSHTWGPPEDEILLSEIMENLELARSKAAYSKVKNTCCIAREMGLEYCWIDTLCIDKSSSAELQEAINSMFTWYLNARICVVYLSDVTEGDIKQIHASSSQFRISRWFTRGWTLQELLAPQPEKVYFYNKDWEGIAARSEICPLLQQITGIRKEILDESESLQSTTVAERFSWASRRETSRREDVAYCLLGLFSLNIPMLYGEGNDAFIRLQEEILKKSSDATIFAWRDQAQSNNCLHGLFADHPSQFALSGGIRQRMIEGHAFGEPPSLTGWGLRIEGRLLQVTRENEHENEGLLGTYALALNCSHTTGPSEVFGMRVALILARVDNNIYMRINVGQFAGIEFSSSPQGTQLIYIPQSEPSFFAQRQTKSLSWALPRNPRPGLFHQRDVETVHLADFQNMESHTDTCSISPMYLSDVDSGKYVPQWWTVKWNTWKSKSYWQVYMEDGNGHVFAIKYWRTNQSSVTRKFFEGIVRSEFSDSERTTLGNFIVFWPNEGSPNEWQSKSVGQSFQFGPYRITVYPDHVSDVANLALDYCPLFLISVQEETRKAFLEIPCRFWDPR